MRNISACSSYFRFFFLKQEQTTKLLRLHTTETIRLKRVMLNWILKKRNKFFKSCEFLKKDCQLHILHHPYDLIQKCKQSLQKAWINLFCHLWVNCIWSTNWILRAAFCVLVLRICQILYRITSYSYPQDCWLTFNLDWLLHATLRFYYCLFNILFLRYFNLLRTWPCYHILPWSGLTFSRSPTTYAKLYMMPAI